MVVLYYNRNLLQKAGVKFPDANTPLIWDDVIDMAKRLTNTTGPTTVWGLDLWWDRFWWQIPRQMGLLDDYQGDENVLKLNDSVAVDALQWLSDLRVKYKVSRPPNDQGPAADFATGSVAMTAQGTWNSGTYRSKLQDDWDVAPLPQFKGKKRVTMGQASPFIMSATTKFKDQTWLLMRYLAGPEGQTVSMENGNSQPMLKAQFNSPAYTKLTPPHSPQVSVNETQFGVPSPYGPAYNDLQALVTQVLAPVYTGQQTAKEAITAAGPSLQQAMNDAKARYG